MADGMFLCTQAEIIPFLSEILMPLVNAIFSVLMSPVDERDQEAANDRKLLRRSYFLFLSTIVSNDCINVFKTLGRSAVCVCVRVRLCVHADHVHKTSLHCCCCCYDVVIKQIATAVE